MLSRMLAGLVMIFALGEGLVVFGAGPAQPAANAFRPDVAEVAPSAFQSRPAAQIAAAGALVQQTDVRIAAAPFSDLLIRWQSPPPLSGMLKLEVRLSRDGRAWTAWTEVRFDSDLSRPDDPYADRWSELIAAGAARFYQLRLTQPTDVSGRPVPPGAIQVHTVDTRIPNEVAPQPTSQATLGGSAGGMASPAGVQPAFVSRTAWGNPQGEAAPAAPPHYYTAQHLIVHHTADSNTLSSGEPNWAARVRAIWAFHTYSRGWGDIGYNWLIDPDGVIYAGRAGSTYLFGDAVGFHDTANYGSVGIALLGTYTAGGPTAASQNSLVNLLAWKASQRGIDPLGSSFYYGCTIAPFCAPYNEGAVVPNIAGHRQVIPGRTTCPGDRLMDLLPAIRQQVYERIKGQIDNGDLIIDNQEARFAPVGPWFESACGYAGHTYWTYATNGSDGIRSENEATWRPNLPSTGPYKVLVHLPQACSISNRTTNARYQVNHADGTMTIPIDQNSRQAWVELGTFKFNAGMAGSVRLLDITSEPYAARRVILVDAVQWVPLAPPPMPTARHPDE